MSGVVWFFMGVFVGVFVGAILMALVAVHRDRE